MNHVMVDLETLDTETTAHVLSIGAATFDPEGGALGDTFYAVMTLSPQESRTISVSTAAWWANQPAAAREEVFGPHDAHGRASGNPDGLDLYAAVSHLVGWIRQRQPALRYFWANDPDFDLAILRSAARQLDLVWPVPYNAGRSLRTISHAAWGEARSLWPERSPDDVAHHALGDARHQARVVCAAWRRLNISVGSQLVR